MPPVEIDGWIDKVARHTYKYLRETHWINEKEIGLKVVNYHKAPGGLLALRRGLLLLGVVCGAACVP